MGDLDRLRRLRTQMGGSEQDYQREEEAMEKEWSAIIGGLVGVSGAWIALEHGKGCRDKAVVKSKCVFCV